MRWLRIPHFLWPLVIIYYAKRLLRIRPTVLESNWVYFLRLSLPMDVAVRREKNSFQVFNPQTMQTASIRPVSSDILVYLQIFFHLEYNKISTLVLPPMPTIVDLGANVGFFLLYAKNIWPDARISCVEPDLQNYHQLTKQIKLNDLSTVTTINGGIWITNEPLSITQIADGMEWGIGVRSDEAGEVNGFTLRQLLIDGGLSKIDLLKMDIEGTEVQLFEDADFLFVLKDSVSNLILETHSHTEQQKISGQLTKLGFVVEPDRELIFARKV